MKRAGKIAGTSAVAAAALGMSAALSPSYAQFVDSVHAVGWGHWAFGGLWFVLAWAVIIVLAIVIVRSLTRRQELPAPPQHPAKPSPLDILAERFARGEIDKADYEERRQMLSEHAKGSAG